MGSGTRDTTVDEIDPLSLTDSRRRVVAFLLDLQHHAIPQKLILTLKSVGTAAGALFDGLQWPDSQQFELRALQSQKQG